MNPTVAKMAGQIALSLVRSKTGQRLLVAVVVLQLVALTIVIWLPSYFAAITATSVQRVVVAPASNCGVDTGPDPTSGTPPPKVTDLSPTQVDVARTIYATALGVGIAEHWSSAKTDRAALVAFAVAMQESRLGAAAGIDRPNGDGDAGVFQQRQKPGWYGTLEQVTQVSYAARVFFRGKVVTAAAVAAARRAGSVPAGPAGYTIPGLIQVRGWENMAITVAAQRVQRSAFPDAYAQHEQISRTLLAVFKDKVDPSSAEARFTGDTVQCGPADAMSCPPTGYAAEAGLNPDALRVLRCVHQSAPEVRDFIGRAARPENPTSDHPAGNAVDVMIPEYASPGGVALGDRIAAWLIDHRKQLGVKYVIWNARIWSVARQDEGWRDYCSTGVPCTDDSSSHRNHVHVSTYGDSAGSGPADAGVGTGSAKPVLPVARVVLTARFGQCSTLWSRCHTGLDFAGPTGTPIRAVLGGRVVSTRWGGAYGNLTKIEVKPGLQFWYAHQSARKVKEGDVVATGQVIGLIGQTGNTTGPHLHLEVRIRGSATDPEVWLRRQGLLG